MTVAADGVEGIARWVARRDQGLAVDAVLMDVHMPGMDGITATRKLRGEDYAGPIIALTANAMSTARARCLEAGCDDFVAKPIDRAELLQKIANWIDRHQPAAQRARPLSARSILVVDDHREVGVAQKLILEQRGYRVAVATSGAEALRLVQDFTPDAALVDLALGDMSGGQLLARLREHPGLSRCVFVCLTGQAPEDVAWREMGFSHFLQKPAQVDDLERALGAG